MPTTGELGGHSAHCSHTGTQASGADIKCWSEGKQNMVKSTLAFKAAYISLARGSHTSYRHQVGRDVQSYHVSEGERAGIFIHSPLTGTVATVQGWMRCGPWPQEAYP